MSKRAHAESERAKLEQVIGIIERDFQRIVTESFKSSDDKVKVVNLSSDFGKTLNGRVGRVVGGATREEIEDAYRGNRHARARVKVEGENEPVKLRLCNILPCKLRHEPDGGKVTLTTARARDLAKESVEKQRLARDQDPGSIARIEATDAWLAKVEGGNEGAPIPVYKCGALGRPLTKGHENGWENLRNQLAPACSGDGEVTFERFGYGLVGVAGEHDRCVVCHEPVTADGDTMGLPCRHVFHRRCLEPWLKKRDEEGRAPDCPTCRTELQMSHEVYTADYDCEEMLKRRFDEFFISGFCVCCQSTVMEADPQVYLDPLNGMPPQVVQRSQVPAQVKYGVRYSAKEFGGDEDDGHFMITRCQGKGAEKISVVGSFGS